MRKTHVKGPAGGAGGVGKSKEERMALRHQGPVAPVIEENLNREREFLKVMVRVTEIVEGVNGHYGYGTIETGVGEAKIGQSVYISNGVASRMADQNYGVGSLVEVKVCLQQGNNHLANRCQWVATFWEIRSSRNVSLNLDDTSVQAKQTAVLDRARKAMTSYRDMPEAASDPVATKAFDDLLVAIGDKEVNAILSSCGRLETQVKHLKALADANARVQQELTRQAQAFDSQADALLAEFTALRG